MPQNLSPLPLGQAIVDKVGASNLFFRLRWQELINGFTKTPTVANVPNATPLNANLVTTAIFTTKVSAKYLVGWDLYRITIDGAASSLQLTVGWTQNSVAKTHVGRLMNTDTLAADPTDPTVLINADANSDITITIAYTSTTPGQMTYGYDAAVLQLA